MYLRTVVAMPSSLCWLYLDRFTGPLLVCSKSLQNCDGMSGVHGAHVLHIAKMELVIGCSSGPGTRILGNGRNLNRPNRDLVIRYSLLVTILYHSDIFLNS